MILGDNVGFADGDDVGLNTVTPRTDNIMRFGDIYFLGKSMASAKLTLDVGDTVGVSKHCKSNSS